MGKSMVSHFLAMTPMNEIMAGLNLTGLVIVTQFFFSVFTDFLNEQSLTILISTISKNSLLLF